MANIEFPADLNERLKDKFVTGMREGKILDRVFEKAHTALLRDPEQTLFYCAPSARVLIRIDRFGTTTRIRNGSGRGSEFGTSALSRKLTPTLHTQSYLQSF